MKFLIIKMLKYLFTPFGILYEAIMGKKNRITILMYHRVNDGIKKEISVKNDNFKWQMDYLKRKKYRVISMDQAVEKIYNNQIGGKYVVLTFDDGYEDFYLNAYPKLKEFEYPALVYAVPGFVETNNVFWWDMDIGSSDLMKWEQLKELAGEGLVEIGSHTMRHYDLNELGYKEIKYEMKESKKVLEEKLKTNIKHFAYPRGIYSEYAQLIGLNIYESGALIFDGKDVVSGYSIKDIMKLKRIPVQRSDGKYLFVARLKGYLVLEEWLKIVFGKY